MSILLKGIGYDVEEMKVVEVFEVLDSLRRKNEQIKEQQKRTD